MIYASPEGLDFEYVRRFLARVDSQDRRRQQRLEALIASGGEELSS